MTLAPEVPIAGAAVVAREAVPATFGKHQRLGREAEFSRVLKSGQRRFSAHFALHWAAPGAPQTDAVARLGVVVAKKLARSSVERNRIKRLMREAFRQHDRAHSGWDMVLRLNRPAADCPGKLLLLELADLLLRAPASVPSGAPATSAAFMAPAAPSP